MAKMLKTAALALIIPGVLATSMPAFADHDNRGWQGRGDNSGYDYRGGYDRQSGYGGYNEPDYRNSNTWRGDDGRQYCRRKDGTTGLLIGGVAGALIGREVAGHRGDRTLGAILGAGIGALLGREVDRSGSRCR